MGYNVAIAGATGNVGREMLTVLEERGFPADTVENRNNDALRRRRDDAIL